MEPEDEDIIWRTQMNDREVLEKLADLMERDPIGVDTIPMRRLLRPYKRPTRPVSPSPFQLFWEGYIPPPSHSANQITLKHAWNAAIARAMGTVRNKAGHDGTPMIESLLNLMEQK